EILIRKHEKGNEPNLECYGKSFIHS
ncbi:uncharacterized protein METZ01_LOCUS211140, partial [marine metagenome]